jgi:hypothetical protein
MKALKSKIFLGHRLSSETISLVFTATDGMA